MTANSLMRLETKLCGFNGRNEGGTGEGHEAVMQTVHCSAEVFGIGKKRRFAGADLARQASLDHRNYDPRQFNY